MSLFKRFEPLDTTAKIREYVERMKETTKKQLRQDKQARRDSETWARPPLD